MFLIASLEGDEFFLISFDSKDLPPFEIEGFNRRIVELEGGNISEFEAATVKEGDLFGGVPLGVPSSEFDKDFR